MRKGRKRGSDWTIFFKHWLEKTYSIDENTLAQGRSCGHFSGLLF